MVSLTASASRFRVTTTAANISLTAASTARHIHTTPYARNHPRNIAADKELCLSVLASASTKREARSYLKRFSPAPPILKYLKESSFTQPGTSEQPPPPLISTENAEIHVGIVKIRDVSAIDAPTLHGIGRTLTQLARLGLPTAVVIDEQAFPTTTAFRANVETQADRVVSAIEAAGGRARRVDGCTSTSTTPLTIISIPELLLAPLARGVIPVLPPLAMDAQQRLAVTTGDQLLLSLTGLLAESGMAVDRIVLLDPLGGIPSHDRPSGAHVFINLAQEHETISNYLHPSSPHARNLQVMRAALSGLPATSSAIITTPFLAASTSLTTSTTATTTTPARATPTKRAKNPLIHSLLTDKPLTSSSLPVQAHNTAGTLTTLLKRGIPLSVHLITHLTDPSIDLPKLVALVEDSFGKRLDLQHYLRRVEGNIAALVVAGDYEGAAIVTWEYPDCDGGEGKRGKRILYLDKFAVLKRSQGTGGVADVVFKGMVEAVRRGALDAEGIVWRSRRWNPVNKWYFERAKGTYKIPDSGWTMFWTSRGGDVEPIGKETDSEAGVRRFMEYEGICRAIEPSLVDE